MPNWVTNRLTIENVNSNTYHSIITLMKSDEESENDSEFDFNELIPIPEDLMIDSTSTEQLADNLLEGKVNISEIDYSAFDPNLNDTHIRLLKKYLENYFKYDCYNWWQWCRRYWGTKWNAKEVHILYLENELTIEFITAWSMPYPIFERLSILYPDLKFKCEFADEDIGSNCGWLVIQNGIIIDRHKFYMQTYESKKYAIDLIYNEPDVARLKELGYDENYIYVGDDYE